MHDNNYNRMCIASSSDEEEMNVSVEKTTLAKTAPSKTTISIANGFVPYGIVSTVKVMIEQLNDVFESLSVVKHCQAHIGRSETCSIETLKRVEDKKRVQCVHVFPFARFRICFPV